MLFPFLWFYQGHLNPLATSLVAFNKHVLLFDGAFLAETYEAYGMKGRTARSTSYSFLIMLTASVCACVWKPGVSSIPHGQHLLTLTSASLCVVTYLSQRDDQAAQCLFFAGEADVVGGNKHLPQDVHLVEGSPQGAVRVSVQFFVFGQTEERSVTLALGSGIQVPAGQRLPFKA